MRLFLGVWLSPEQRREVERFLIGLRRRYPDWKWTSPGNLHITLKFLGEVHSDRLALLKTSFAGCAMPMRRFQIRLGGLGIFPERGIPNVLWLSLAVGGPELQQLAALIEKAGAEAGFARENRPFRPHLTLARSRPGVAAAVPGEDEAPQYPLRSCTEVSSFALIESKLTASGPDYHSLAEFPFGVRG